MKRLLLKYFCSMSLILITPNTYGGDIFSAPNIYAEHVGFMKAHNNTNHLKNMSFAVNDGISRGKRMTSKNKNSVLSSKTKYVNSIVIGPGAIVTGDVILIQQQDTYIYTK